MGFSGYFFLGEKCRTKICGGKIIRCHWRDTPCGTKTRRANDGPTLFIISGDYLPSAYFVLFII
jgi:hypothetical protein